MRELERLGMFESAELGRDMRELERLGMFSSCVMIGICMCGEYSGGVGERIGAGACSGGRSVASNGVGDDDGGSTGRVRKGIGDRRNRRRST
jgi:hypothetical protein